MKVQAPLYFALFVGLLSACDGPVDSPADAGSDSDAGDVGSPEPDTPEPNTPEPNTPEPNTPEPNTPEPNTPEPENRPPRVLSFSTNTTRVTEGGAVVFSAVVTDADGIADVIGGTLSVRGGPQTFGTFSTTAEEGAYTFNLTWSAIDVVEPISFDTERTLEVDATFFDSVGNETVEQATLTLHCDGVAACSGNCVDLATSEEHCGECGNAIPDEYGACVAGEIQCEQDLELCDNTCVNLGFSPEHCGACNNPINTDDPQQACRYGEPSCSANFNDRWLICEDVCADVTVTNCNHCGNDCNEHFDGRAMEAVCNSDPDTPTLLSGPNCNAWVETTSFSRTCDEVCADFPQTQCGGSSGTYRPIARYNDNGNTVERPRCDELPSPTLFASMECPCAQIFD